MHGLGSAWIPEKDIEQFAQDFSDTTSRQSVQVRHLSALGAWAIQADYRPRVPWATRPNGELLVIPPSA